MVEYLRRKNLTESAEATVEVGRLLYLLGRHAEALQKFDEALEQDADRDQSYIDIVAFLVQNGETDAALGIYHRALARPGRAVSEYVKVYTSLWVLDLSRRTTKVARPQGGGLPRARSISGTASCGPHRGAAWYHLLARYAVGKLSYEQALAAADTAGKRAEIYFYEGMRRLSDGKADDAHQLWQKVIDTPHVLVLRVRHGLALPARRGAHLARPAPPPRRRPPQTTQGSPRLRLARSPLRPARGARRALRARLGSLRPRSLVAARGAYARRRSLGGRALIISARVNPFRAASTPPVALASRSARAFSGAWAALAF